MARLFRDLTWNSFRKGSVSTKYKVRAEYEIRLYSPLSYTAFGADNSVIGKWHYLAYFIARVLSNLSCLLHSMNRIKRAVQLGKSANTATVDLIHSKKCSEYAVEWLNTRHTTMNRDVDLLETAATLILGMAITQPKRWHAYTNIMNKRFAVRRINKLRSSVTVPHNVGFALRSGAYLFNAVHRIVRLRNIRKKHKSYSTCKQSYAYSAISCLYVLFVRCLLYILSGMSCISYLRIILYSARLCVNLTWHWVNLYRYIFGSSVMPKVRQRQTRTRKRKRRHKHITTHESAYNYANKQLRERKPRKPRKRRMQYVLLRYKSYRSWYMKGRCVYGTPVFTLYYWRIFFLSYSINNIVAVPVRSSVSQITELFGQLRAQQAQQLRLTYYRSVLDVSLRRAFSYSNQILPLQKSFWSIDSLIDLFSLLVSLDVDVTKLNYRDVLTLIMRGKYKGSALNVDIYKDNPRSKSRSKLRGDATTYRKASDLLGKVGITDDLFYDLSFFLKLNYDIDLYRFYSFCKWMCSGSMTLHTALWLFELTYVTFFTTYFITAAYSFSADIYINNSCYTYESDRVMCIGDMIEVRNCSAFVDSFIVICNIIEQCRLYIIKQFWFISLLWSIRPFLLFYKWIKQEKFFRFPKWNMLGCTSHYMIRPSMYYSNSKFRRLGVALFNRKFFVHYISGLERTLHVFFLYLFKEAHFIWNITISFTICWRYSINLRSALYKNNAFIGVSNTGDLSCQGILRRIVHLQHKMARYVFRKRANCVSSSIQILVRKPITSNWQVSKVNKDRRYMFSEIWSCKLEQAKHDKRSIFGWYAGKAKARAYTDKAIEIPTFLYRFYRSEHITERISFEKDTAENAWRCANLFTVFFLFFKYGQRHSLVQNAIKQQRRVIKAAVPALRVNLINARNWARVFRKRRNKRIFRKRRIQKKLYKLHGLIQHKLSRGVVKRRTYVDFADLSDWLQIHGKWPKHARKHFRTPWWYDSLIKKPRWLYNITKPENVRINMPWWYSVRPFRFYANKRLKSKYKYTRFADRMFSNLRAIKKSRQRLNRNWGARYRYIPDTSVARNVWSRRRKKFRRRNYKHYKLEQVLEGLGNYVHSRYKSYWYRVYRKKHNVDFVPLPVRKIPYRVRKALAFKQGGRYSSNRLGKLAYNTWVSGKLCNTIKDKLANFADLYSDGVLGKPIYSRTRKSKRGLYLVRRRTFGTSAIKRNSGISKAYHTRSNKSFDSLIVSLSDNFVREKANKKDRNRNLPTGISFLQQSKVVKSDRTRRMNDIKFPSLLKFNKYINDAALSEVWGVLSNKSYRFSKYLPYKFMKQKKNRFRFNIHFNTTKYANKKWRSFGIRGSFYKDSKFLSFFIKKCKLRNAKKKIMFLLYTQLYKHVQLYKSYLLRFISSKLFYRLRFRLLTLLISKYKNKRYHFILNRQVHSKYSERLLFFFNTLGKAHVQYYSTIRPVVKQCISIANYNELLFQGNKFSYNKIDAPHWRYAKSQRNYKSTLLHYFTKNMLLSPDMFTIYGKNILLFSIRNVKLHLCVDHYGNAINEFLLHKKIDEFFPSDNMYTDFKDVK